MNNFAKTPNEKKALKTAKTEWKNYIKNKYPQDIRTADAIWMDNLTVNTKLY